MNRRLPTRAAPWSGRANKMPARKALLALTVLLSMTACESLWKTEIVAAPANDCAWAKRIITDPGWEQRFTANEKRQVTAHNEDVKAKCRSSSSLPSLY